MSQNFKIHSFCHIFNSSWIWFLNKIMIWILKYIPKIIKFDLNYPDCTLFDELISMIDPRPCWKKGFATFLWKIRTEKAGLVMELSLLSHQNIGQNILQKGKIDRNGKRKAKMSEKVNRHNNDKMYKKEKKWKMVKNEEMAAKT